MVDAKTLAEFERRNMGWLTDEGELLVCGLHEHMGRLAGVPRFAEAHRRYEETCAANEDDMRRELDALGPDEHPAMHRFSGMNDDAKDALVKVVYTAGWIRLGHSFDATGALALSRRDGIPLVRVLKDADAWYVEAEGLTEAVRGRRRVLDGIVRALGCRLVLREMRYEAVNLGTKRRPHVRELLVPEAYEAGRN